MRWTNTTNKREYNMWGHHVIQTNHSTVICALSIHLLVELLSTLRVLSEKIARLERDTILGSISAKQSIFIVIPYPTVGLGGKISYLFMSALSLSAPYRSTNRKGPPQKGGNPRPKTEAISPSDGVAMIPSSRHITASFTNRETIRNCWSDLDELKQPMR